MGNNPSTPLITSQVNISDFELDKVIGEGAFGKVYKIKHIRRQERYALKAIAKAHCVKTNKTRHVIRERMFLEQLDHPLICNLKYAFQDEHNLYMAMDLMLGGDMRRCLDQHGPLPEDLVRFWMSELICAVKYLHSKGIMHRDIKPENLLLDVKGHLHLTDFNIATRIRKPYDRLLTSPSGTLVYFAPELVKGYGYTEDVDWWGVGITFYECIYGKRPWREYEGKDDILNQIVRGHIPYPVQINGTVSANCLSVIQGLLETNPMYRLGHEGKNWEQLVHHPFFQNTPWQDINSKKSLPPNNIDLQSYTAVPSSPLPISKTKKIETDLLQLSTIVSSSPMTQLPALSKESHGASSSTSSSACNNNNNNNGAGGGWLAAVYDYLTPPKEHDMSDTHYAQRLEALETAFTLFDWTMYDDYQGFMNKTTLCVGSPPSWVKPAFTDADNGRVLPVPTLSTSNDPDDDLTMTPPVTPTDGSFPDIYHDYPHQVYHIPQIKSYQHHQTVAMKKRRRSSTKYFNERRDWERRKSLLITTPHVGLM